MRRCGAASGFVLPRSLHFKIRIRFHRRPLLGHLGGFALIAFLVFRLHDGISRYFSVHDALDVMKAAAFSQLMTTVVLFTFTRLDGIPRSTPIIQALILGTGLIAIRAIAQALHNSAKVTNGRNHVARENIIIIGATHLSSLYIKLLEACSPGQRRVIALLDDRPQLIGRSMSGIRILATPQYLKSVIEEFVVHGLPTNRVIISDKADLLIEGELEDIQRVCEQREIKLDFVAQLIGLGEVPLAPTDLLPPLIRRVNQRSLPYRTLKYRAISVSSRSSILSPR